MNGKIKKFFLVLKRFNERGLILARPVAKWKLWFGAFLFLVILGLTLPFRTVRAAAWWDVLGQVGEAFVNAVISLFIKYHGILLLPILLLATLIVGIAGAILGWIIGPHFISLKFTQNPFVDIGLSITRNFANMGFIIFLVAIALATALRIKEYKAKKTLPTLILVALLINFSPVFCGIIIDATNVVMNFFLSAVTGLTGFVNFLQTAGDIIWNLIIGSGFDAWANLAAFMQLLIVIVFDIFATYIFILFSVLFIMRYIMLWILVILSPIAFVSYILPITRRGGSLLSWRTWWKQLIAWSIIGIIAAFFLYLGFTMISLIAAAGPGGFVTYPDLGEGLGLMNNILPYLIPLVLLLIAHRETKRTSAMFAKEIIEKTEKVIKSTIGAAAKAAMMVATKGMSKAAAGLGKAAGAQKGLTSKALGAAAWTARRGRDAFRETGRAAWGDRWARRSEEEYKGEEEERVKEAEGKFEELKEFHNFAKEHKLVEVVREVHPRIKGPRGEDIEYETAGKATQEFAFLNHKMKAETYKAHLDVLKKDRALGEKLLRELNKERPEVPLSERTLETEAIAHEKAYKRMLANVPNIEVRANKVYGQFISERGEKLKTPPETKAAKAPPETGAARMKIRKVPETGEKEKIVTVEEKKAKKAKEKTLWEKMKEYRRRLRPSEMKLPEEGAGFKEWAKTGLKESFKLAGKTAITAFLDAIQEGAKAGFEQAVKEIVTPITKYTPKEKKRKLKEEVKEAFKRGEEPPTEEEEWYEEE